MRRVKLYTKSCRASGLPSLENYSSMFHLLRLVSWSLNNISKIYTSRYSFVAYESHGKQIFIMLILNLILD